MPDLSVFLLPGQERPGTLCLFKKRAALLSRPPWRQPGGLSAGMFCIMRPLRTLCAPAVKNENFKKI
jgi:hypothetical protein